ncbi:hypothetical protein J6590_004274 [Homalodisca vitripennis]|nr:hypothetical protein J6590_004274 [Homalodisca vitripennis]
MKLMPVATRSLGASDYRSTSASGDQISHCWKLTPNDIPGPVTLKCSTRLNKSEPAAGKPELSISTHVRQSLSQIYPPATLIIAFFNISSTRFPFKILAPRCYLELERPWNSQSPLEWPEISRNELTNRTEIIKYLIRPEMDIPTSDQVIGHAAASTISEVVLSFKRYLHVSVTVSIGDDQLQVESGWEYYDSCGSTIGPVKPAKTGETDRNNAQLRFAGFPPAAGLFAIRPIIDGCLTIVGFPFYAGMRKDIYDVIMQDRRCEIDPVVKYACIILDFPPMAAAYSGVCLIDDGLERHRELSCDGSILYRFYLSWMSKLLRKYYRPHQTRSE